jgi:hypothetical protein
VQGIEPDCALFFERGAFAAEGVTKVLPGDGLSPLRLLLRSLGIIHYGRLGA